MRRPAELDDPDRQQHQWESMPPDHLLRIFRDIQRQVREREEAEQRWRERHALRIGMPISCTAWLIGAGILALVIWVVRTTIALVH